MSFIKMASMTGVIALVLFAGSCSKKVTKVSVTPQTKEAMAPPVMSSQPEPASSDNFVTVEADSILKATLKTIYFDFDKATIRSDVTPTLENIGRLLMTRKEVKVLMEGNCDERGSEEYNMGLGQHRAQSIKDWLVSYGVGEDRLETTSYGKERPAFPNCQDEACHAKNRRVEFKVLSGSTGPVSQNVR